MASLLVCAEEMRSFRKWAGLLIMASLTYGLPNVIKRNMSPEEERRHLFDNLLQQHLGLVRPETTGAVAVTDVPDFVMEQVRVV